MLEIKNLEKTYSKQQVLKSISVSARQGKIIGLVGVNGSGKSTLLKCISGLIQDYNGLVHYDGKISYSIENPTFYNNITVYTNLKLFTTLSGTVSEKTIDNILEKVGLTDAKNKKVSELSLGMKQKLAIARMILSGGDIFLLDEPFNGLDYITKLQLRDIILDLKGEGKLIIISSHILEELGQICDTVWHLTNGLLKSSINLQDNNRIYTLRFIDQPNALKFCQDYFQVDSFSIEGNIVTIKIPIERSKVTSAIEYLVKNQFMLIEFYDSTNNLLDVLVEE
ncbi:ABC transporter ATP-binding protein [Streptococcus troglodytae]